MKVAIIHDWLVTYAGAERVLEQIINIYPDADIFSLVDFIPKNQRFFIKNKKVYTSFIQKLPFAKNKYRSYLPLMPLAIEQFDLSPYELIISSSHAVAKGVITGPDQVHVCYIHSPIRYAWDLQHQYLNESGLAHGLKGFLARFFLHYIRNFDARSSLGVDTFIANSRFIAKRVAKCYRRASEVVYPPVNLDDFSLETEKQDYYVSASRLVPYKRMDLIAEAFSRMPDKKLLIIGDGPDIDKVRAAAKGASNVMVLGYLPFPEMKKHMQNAKAFVFAAEEDFGITPVEAMACGTPVIAYGKGGALETVINEKTGLLFYNQNIDSIIDATNRFEGMHAKINPVDCRKQAELFSVDLFREKFSKAVDNAIKNPSFTSAN